MKKTLLTLTVSTLIIGAGLTGCNTPVEKIEKAQENVTESKAALEKVEADYTTDMVKFRKDSDERIAANQKNLDEFNERIAKEKKVAKTVKVDHGILAEGTIKEGPVAKKPAAKKPVAAKKPATPKK